MALPTACILNISGKEQGPFTIEEVLARLGRGEVQLTDYMFNDVLQDWVALIEVPAIQEHLRGNKPKARPSPTSKPSTEPSTQAKSSSSISTLPSVREWFVLKWDTRIGPFSTLDLVRMLQEKSVFEFEFIWKQGLDGWKRMADIEEFQSSKIKQLYQSDKSSAFVTRENPRVPFQLGFMAHDGNNLWSGSGIELSVGGAHVRMEFASLLPGQTVTLHIRGSKNFDSINFQSEIVGKKFRAGRLERNSIVEYSVRFISLDERTKHILSGWIAKQAS
jgi:hypothetical protein